jgi:hypothetical protein
MKLSNTFVESFGCLEDSRYKNKRHLLLDIILSPKLFNKIISDLL